MVVVWVMVRCVVVDLWKVIEDLCEGADLFEEDAYAAMEALLDVDLM